MVTRCMSEQAPSLGPAIINRLVEDKAGASDANRRKPLLRLSWGLGMVYLEVTINMRVTQVQVVVVRDLPLSNSCPSLI